MFRALVYILIAIFLITVVRMFLGIILKGFGEAMQANRVGGTQRPGTPASPAGGELKRDPVCGTFVPASSSVKKELRGEVMHFCSPECRDKYVASA
jgi:YHS domain-containing protein